MLHLGDDRHSDDEGTRKWFAENIWSARNMLYRGHRETARGQYYVLHNMVTFGNLRGTDTGEQMESCMVALLRCIGRNMVKESNARYKEMSLSEKWQAIPAFRTQE